MKKRNAVKWIGLAVIIVLLIGGCWAYAADYYRADENAIAAMSSRGNVRVVQDSDMTAFIPENAEAGLIFYPGGKVEYTAYAPLMDALAQEDILCVLTRMPLNLAVLNMNAAEGIAEEYPQIEKWYIGGHSLGGSMAASHAAANSEKYEGVVLLASYSTADLKAGGLKVLSVYGSEDGVLNMEKYRQYRSNLPQELTEVVIEGGCHAGFGSYGAQVGDGEPTITAQQQIGETAERIAEFIGR